MQHRHTWKTAPPLWDAALAGTVDLDRPALLRFSTDEFIPQLQAELADPAGDVGRLVAVPETWRAPAAGLGSTGTGGTLKLFQPTHGRFYLVAAALVCERYGLPDRRPDGGDEEAAYFVLRRLEPTGSAPVDPADPATHTEYGWVGERWQQANGGVAAGEERLPLFALSYGSNGSRRRLLAGMVPVSAREKYEGAVAPEPLPPISTDPLADLTDERLDKLEAAVVAMQALLELAESPLLAGAASTSDEVEQFREAFFFALVDLAEFVHDELPAVWAGTATGAGPVALQSLLGSATFLAGLPTVTWRAALGDAYDNRAEVLATRTSAPEPVTGMTVAQVETAIGNLGVTTDDPNDPVDAVVDPTSTSFFDTAAAALAATPAPAPDDDGNGDGDDGNGDEGASFTDGAVYVARCVYERPNCLPSQRVQLSRASEAFRLSHFYDPDAPYRDSPIVLPVDTSLEGLRKFPNAARVAISAQLRRQLDRVQNVKLGDLDDGNIPGERGLDLGMICSLSIPIITICALILLMIIVSLLNIVFFWLPLFKICKPKVG